MTLPRLIPYALLTAVSAVALWSGWTLRGTDVEQRGAEVRILEQSVALMAEERDFWRRRSLSAHEALLSHRQRIVEVTAYTGRERECDSDPHIAASNKPPRPGTVAVSRDLFDLGWTFGKRVYLKGLGAYEINDVMNARFQHRVDVFMDHKRQAREFGVRMVEARLG